MKHYLVLMATLASQAPMGASANPTAQTTVPQVIVAANTTTLPTAAQLENAAQAIVLPPTTPTSSEVVVAAPAPAVQTQPMQAAGVNVTATTAAAPRIVSSDASLAATNPDVVPAVALPKTETAIVTENGMSYTQPTSAVAQPSTVNGQPSIATGQPLTTTETVPAATIAQPVEAPNLTEHALLAFGAVIGLGIFGVTLVRLKKRGALGFGKSDRAQMEIISQMTLSPKRKIILVRIRDQEIALASTEHGITMLTEVSSAKPARQSIAATNVETRLVGAPRSESRPRESIAEAANSAKKSESFLNALKNIKTKTTQQHEQTTQSQANESEAPKASGKSSPTMSQTRGAFPKYLANAFQQEGNRKVSGKSTDSGDEENLENVTNMIREKLKNIHQAG